MSLVSKSMFVVSVFTLASGATPVRLSAAIIFAEDGESVGHNSTPTPSVGSWTTGSTTITREFGNATLGTNSKGYTTPNGPDGGDNVMVVDRGSSPVVGRYNWGDFQTTAVTGDTLHFEFDALVIGGPLSFGFTSSTDSNGLLVSGYRMSTITYINGTRAASGPVTAINVGDPAALTSGQAAPGGTTDLLLNAHTVGSWQHYEVKYTLGTSSYEVTAGSTSVTSSKFYGTTTTSLTSIEGIYFQASGGTVTGYFDNVSVAIVPETSSLAMLGITGLAMLRRRARDRE